VVGGEDVGFDMRSFSVEMVLVLYSFAAEVGIVADLVVRSDLVVSDLQAHCAGPDATVRTVRPCKPHRGGVRLRLELCRSADGRLFAPSFTLQVAFIVRPVKVWRRECAPLHIHPRIQPSLGVVLRSCTQQHLCA
jgi:hypothetical protein